MNGSAPALDRSGPAAGACAVVLLLPGGRATSLAPARRGPAYLRMVPFARAIRWSARGEDVAVWTLRYRVRGWNGPAADPVRDGRWALDEARRVHPGAALAARIGATFVPVPGEAHTLLRRPVFWTRLVTGFVTAALRRPAHAR